MKKLFLPLLILLLLTGFSFAQMNQDSILVVPKTSIPPVIDGELDTLAWNYVGETLCITMDAGDAELPFDWFDLFGSLRMMFDDEYLYLWLYVQDDYLVEGADYQYDGVELYFDADNSKTFEDYDGYDDIQMRFNVGETTTDEIDLGYGNSTNWGFISDGIDYVVIPTDYGWNLEAAIPLLDLQLIPGELFGFDAQINDADDEEALRENMYRWWSNDNNEWIHANLFGTALLDNNRVLKDFLEIPKGSAPTIDGEMAADEWDDAVEISGSRLDASMDLYEHVWGWEDCRNWGWVKWDDDNFYYYLRMWDDWYDYAEDESENWEYDSVELYFDGDNSDTAPYDGYDDIQIRFNLGQEGSESIDAGYGTGADWGWNKETTEYVVIETERGWDVEASIPLEDMQIPVGMDFGFDWQLNDCDDPDVTPNRTVYRWWAPSEPEWNDASMFGTCVLVPAFVNVEEEPSRALVNTYELSQNYPNPFNPSTNITYTVPKQSKVTLAVYDLLGKEVARLVDEVKPAGQYTVTFDAHNMTSGIYFYKLNNGENQLTKKMTLMK